MQEKRTVKDLYERSARKIAERLVAEETAPLLDTIVRLKAELALREAENTRLRSDLAEMTRAYDRLATELSALERRVFAAEREVTAGLSGSRSG